MHISWSCALIMPVLNKLREDGHRQEFDAERGSNIPYKSATQTAIKIKVMFIRNWPVTCIARNS